MTTTVDLDAWRALPPEGKQRLRDRLRAETEKVLSRAWRKRARPDQLPPAGWLRTWYVRGGRFGGKTWTGSNALAELIREHPVDPDGEPTEWAVVAPTFADARDTCVENRRSGLLRALGLPQNYDGWNRSQGQLRLPTGQLIYACGADDGALRVQGKNLSGVWCDEVGLWKKWQLAWDESIAYAVRILPALIIATGTPKRNMPARALIRKLLDDPDVVHSRLRSQDNRANIAGTAWDELSKQAGTTLGKQELEGDLLDDVEGALWNVALLRWWDAGDPPLSRTVVSVDPSGSTDGDATGIVVLGMDDTNPAGPSVMVMDDRTCQGSPEERAEAAVLAAYEHAAGTFVVESNYGGDLFAATLRSAWEHLRRGGRVRGLCPAIEQVTARGSKADRAAPVVQVYEQGRAFHWPTTPDALSLLEDEMVTWTPADDWSPNRLDALVHGVRFLLGETSGRQKRVVVPQGRWGAVPGRR